MEGFANITASLGQKAELIGRTLARSGAQLAAHPVIPANPGTTGHTGVAGTAGSTNEAAPASQAPAREMPVSVAGSPSITERTLGAVGHVFGVAINIEKALSAPFAKIPFPGLPATRVGDYAFGLPHAHNHPPNLTPPNPVPVPLPGVGPVMAIPYVSGARSTFIEKAPAARCGDIGTALVCGGLFPFYELFLGSSSGDEDPADKTDKK